MRTGTIAFKINEESPDVKYPTRAVYDFLAEMFNTANVSFGQLSNVFDLSNTYIFEIDPPKSVAETIERVKMGIYPETEEYLMVYEDYLSSIDSFSKYDSDALCCVQFWELSTSRSTNYDGSIKEFVLSECDPDAQGLSINFNDPLAETVENIELLSGLSSEWSDQPPVDYTSEVTEMDVDEKSIQDYMKIYVNYLVDSNDKIHMYFNYNNFFCSPYSYRRRDGRYYTQFKPETYLHLEPGESGLLTNVIQFKYFDGDLNVRGIKDVPVLTYKIWKESMRNAKDVVAENLSVSLSINDTVKLVGMDKLNDNCLTKEELTGMVDVVIESDKIVPYRSLTCDFIYEYNDPDLLFDPEKSTGGSFSERNGRIRAITTNSESNEKDGIGRMSLCFKLKQNSAIDEDDPVKRVPVDAMNLAGIDVNGNRLIPAGIKDGGLTFQFGSGGEMTYRFLAKEWDNPDLDNFNGYIMSETDRPIRVYSDTGKSSRTPGVPRPMKIFDNGKITAYKMV